MTEADAAPPRLPAQLAGTSVTIEDSAGITRPALLYSVAPDLLSPRIY